MSEWNEYQEDVAESLVESASSEAYMRGLMRRWDAEESRLNLPPINPDSPPMLTINSVSERAKRAEAALVAAIARQSHQDALRALDRSNRWLTVCVWALGAAAFFLGVLALDLWWKL